MLRITRLLGTTLLALALYAGLAACGGDDEPGTSTSRITSEPTPDLTGDPTASPTGSPTEDPTGSPTGTATAAVGLPTDFPTTAVPVLPGVVTGKTGPAPTGPKGWVIEMSATGSQKSCFKEAAAALIADGFTKQDELIAADTRQAQFTSSEYAVVLSVRADGDELCQVSYEVGEVAR